MRVGEPPVKTNLVRLTVILLALGCAASPPRASSPAVASPPLYDRLGGKGAITAVVDEFVSRIAKDSRINARFANTDMPHLRTMLIEQICQATGGPCTYAGKDMRTTHAGMKITAGDFDALVGDLKDALDKFQVPAAEEHDLLGALGGMKPDVVQVPAVAGGGVGVAEGSDIVLGRAHAFRDAAGLLEQADSARLQANRSLADELFTSAELLTGPAPVADLSPLFREGAPPRVTAPLTMTALDTPPQPATVGSSEQDEPDPKPRRGSLTGVVLTSGGRTAASLAVVTLEPVSGKFRHRTPKQRVIEQRDRQFAPRVLTVPVGSTVSFPNFDGIFHNVFSRSETKPFDLGIYKNGQTRALAFEKEGIVRVGCNLHANMSAVVVVVSAPHYVITDAQGRFAFRSLDPGRYLMRVWSEASEAPHSEEIEIKPAQNSVTLSMEATRPVGPLADKFGAPRGTAHH
jgi:hemoglobin